MRAKRRLLFVSAAIALLTISGECRAGDANVTLEVIRAALREQLTSVHSIYVRCGLWYTPSADAPFPDPFDGRSWGPQTIEWAEQGPQKMFAAGPIPLEDYPPVRIWCGFDGTRGYSLNESPDDGIKRLREVLRTPDLPPDYWTMQHPGYAAGLRIWQTEHRLDELISRPDAQLEGQEPVDERKCWKVTIAAVLNRAGRVYRITAWLDPTYDYLPRQIALRDHNPPAADEPPWMKDWHLTIKVRDFQEVPDGLLHRNRWYPAEILIHELGSVGRMVIEDVSINSRLPISRFQPELTFGTKVIDGPRLPGRPERSYVVGGQRAIDELARRQIERAKATAPPIPPAAALVDARRSESTWLRWWLLASSVMLVLGGAAWRARSLIRQ